MTSGKYVAMSPHGRILSFSETTKNNQMVGGAVPVLLKHLIKTPVTGAGINESGKSNIMVGMITTPSTPSPTTARVTTGGELLNNLQKLRFGKGKANRNESNIKFVF